MAAFKIFRPQGTAEALFQTTDAKATTIRFHAGRLPHSLANGIDLRPIIYSLLNAVIAFPLPRRLCCFDGLFHFGPVKQAGSCIGTTVDTIPTFRNFAFEVNRFVVVVISHDGPNACLHEIIGGVVLVL
jgi:hypothetical protein